MPQGIRVSRTIRALTTGEGKLWLVLVGVNQYQDRALPPLRYCASDCQGIGEALLEATRTFPNKQLLWHHDFAADLPTRKAVEASLERLIAEAGPQDTVLFYFCGHGAIDAASRQAVLCLADTRLEDLCGSGLTMRRLLESLGRCRAAQQLVWLDACHSGGLSLRNRELTAEALPAGTILGMEELLRERAAQSRGFYALLACEQSQQSWEFPGLGHGVFTYFLIRGLRGEAANARGFIEMDGLYRYVYHQTLRYIDNINQQLRLENLQKLRRGGELHPEYALQVPKRIVEGVGELILGVCPTEAQPLSRRRALVIDGLAGEQEAPLVLSKLLTRQGGFEVKYWNRRGLADPASVRELLRSALSFCSTAAAPVSGVETLLIYLRGRLQSSAEGESRLVLGDGVRLNLLWLRQQLQSRNGGQLLLVLDCPGKVELLEQWVELLRVSPQRTQCLVAGAASDPQTFSRALLDALEGSEPQGGLSAAKWASQLQQALAGTGTELLVELSGPPGVIEVFPANLASAGEGAPMDLGVCPYMGLRAFGEEDAPYFYGREHLTQELLKQLAGDSFLAVVGASGSGKSSVVHAGLIAQLRTGRQLPGSQSWWVQSMRPGAHPLEALSWRLADAADQNERHRQQQQIEGLLHLGADGLVQWLRKRPEPMVVLVVDQFEELFTLASPTDRQVFLDVLLGALVCAADRFKLVIAVRADFIAPCLEVAALAPLVQAASVLVPPYLGEDDYRNLIVKPAQKVGLVVEPELVEVLLQELNQSPGELPLLEFVLEQLWEKRQDGHLTLNAYQQAIGGLKGALENRAQATYEALGPEGKDCARWIFLSLTQLGEGTEDTRRRVPRSDLVVARYPEKLVFHTLQALTAAKLVVVGFSENTPTGRSRSRAEAAEPESLAALKQQVTVEVAHEVLIRYWSTLRWWLEENRARLRLQRQIEQAATLWNQRDQQPDFLLRGVRLAEAEEIYTHRSDELSQEVQVFVEACLEEKRKQRDREKGELRKAQIIALVMVVLTIAASGFGGLAYWQTQIAQQSEISAHNTSVDGYLASHRSLEALIASIKAQNLLRRTLVTDDNLKIETASHFQQVMHMIRESNRFVGHGNYIRSTVFSPNGQTIASASEDSTVRLWKTDGTILRIFSDHQADVRSLAFSPDGKTLASGDFRGNLVVRRLDGSVLTSIKAHNKAIMGIAFTPDGKYIVTASADKSAHLWKADDYKLLKTFNGHTGWLSAVAVSPDGESFATASADKTVRIWNKNGATLKTISHPTEVYDLSFAPDGQTLATGGEDKVVRLWHLDGNLARTLSLHTGWVMKVAFSPEGNVLATASADKTIRLWRVVDGTLLITIHGHTASVNSLSYSPDGRSLVSGGDDTTVRLWQVDKIKGAFQTYGSELFSIAISPDSQMIATAGADGNASLWRLDGTLLKNLQGHRDKVFSVTISSDGKKIATAGADKTIRLWSISGELLGVYQGHQLSVASVVFSPDCTTLASVGIDGTVRLWSSDGTGRVIGDHTGSLEDIRFSPDGRVIASVGSRGTLQLWSSISNSKSAFVVSSGSVRRVAYSPDGKLIATGDVDGNLKLWNFDGSSLSVTLYKEIPAHEAEIRSMTFSYDGQYIATASADGSTRIWKSDGSRYKILLGSSDGINSVRFSYDDSAIVTAGENGMVEVWENWNTSEENLRRTARQWICPFVLNNTELSETLDVGC
ncbi:caspase family protein [Gloeobacter morelensis]|uniref:Caspase family protein n=1 Tax=Gloeobacter morelensis MG652769 TaxID=2781736 RepID=A0ABY3PSK4_9CYAN|nr:caspase family protein [Gloeobacter morelensis]UFP96722.1 caspase family protein [Gloeobacter morelensis MG652769]